MPHGETAGDKMSLTGADHRARAPRNLCGWRAPLAACWEEGWSDGLGLASLPALCGGVVHMQARQHLLPPAWWHRVILPTKPGFAFCGCLGNPEFLKIQKGHFRKKWWEGEWL